MDSFSEKVSLHHSTRIFPTKFSRLLSTAIQKQPVAGTLISEVLLHTLKSQNIPVTPQYLVKTKETTAPDQPSNASLRYVLNRFISGKA